MFNWLSSQIMKYNKKKKKKWIGTIFTHWCTKKAYAVVIILDTDKDNIQVIGDDLSFHHTLLYLRKTIYDWNKSICLHIKKHLLTTQTHYSRHTQYHKHV